MSRLARLFMAGAAIGFAALAAIPAYAETPVGTNVESRVVLAFKVNDAGAAALVPEGWKTLTLPKGPLAGSNLLVLFSDRHLGIDPEGKPIDPASSRYAVLVGYGVKADVQGPRMFVSKIYETPPVVDLFGSSVAAEIARETSLAGSDHGPRRLHEAWSVKSEDGETISFDLAYDMGMPGWSPGEAMPYSAANPEFAHIYRYTQLADLAMSAAIGRELNGEVAFTAEGGELGSLFDGTETMTAITVIPVYVRNVFLP